MVGDSHVEYLSAGIFAILAAVFIYVLNGSGVPSETLRGTVEECEIAGGPKSPTVDRAVVRLESGETIRVFVNTCARDTELTIDRSRGRLFFNSKYVAIGI